MNWHRGEASLTVRGRTYALVFDLNAFAELEGALGEPLERPLHRLLARQVALRDVRALVWAGLRARHPDVSLQEAGDLLAEVGLRPALSGLVPALIAALPKPEEATGSSRASPPPAAAGTGSGS